MGLFVHCEGLKKKAKKDADLIIITNSNLLTSLVLVTVHLLTRNIFAGRQ